jgi:hypothetical protein
VKGPTVPDGGSGLNRHERRRRAARQRRATISDFHDAANGVLTLQVLTPPALVVLWVANFGLARSLADWIDRIERNRPLCLCCDRGFSRDLAPTAWVLAAPSNASAEVAMLMGVCSGAASAIRAPRL